MYASGKTQPLEEKVEALETLLPVAWIHLDRMREARCVTRYGSPETVPGPPPPGWSVFDCDGRCRRCEYERQCQGEWWEAEMKRMQRKYHLSTVASAWLRLEARYPDMAAAVYGGLVEEHDKSLVIVQSSRSADRRRKLQRAGLKWMARYIRRDLTPFYEKPKTTEEKVRELLTKGITSSFIIHCRVGVTVRRVQQIRKALVAAEGGQDTPPVDEIG